MKFNKKTAWILLIVLVGIIVAGIFISRGGSISYSADRPSVVSSLSGGDNRVRKAKVANFAMEESVADFNGYADESAPQGLIAPAPKSDGSLGDVQGVEKKIIRTANLDIFVDDTNETVEEVTKIVDGTEGFVQDVNVYKAYDDSLNASLTIRVPVEGLDSILASIKDLAKTVESERVSGRDVTEEFVDTEARLKNLKAEEQQFLEIMKRAVSIEDTLNVTKELSRVRGDIESMQARLNYLSSQSSMSTIHLTIEEGAEVSITVGDFDFVQSVKDAVRGLVQTGQGAVVALVYVVIFGLPIALVVLVIWKMVSTLRKRKRLKK